MPSTQFFIGCVNMGQYDHTGIAMLEDCPTEENQPHMMRESCHWVCKHGRPVARCFWQFNTSDIAPGPLETCWISEACSGTTVDVNVACKPQQFNVTTQVVELQRDLAAAIFAHRSAEQKVQEVEAAHNATKALLDSHRSSLSRNLTK